MCGCVGCIQDAVDRLSKASDKSPTKESQAQAKAKAKAKTTVTPTHAGAGAGAGAGSWGLSASPGKIADLLAGKAHGKAASKGASKGGSRSHRRSSHVDPHVQDLIALRWSAASSASTGSLVADGEEEKELTQKQKINQRKEWKKLFQSADKDGDGRFDEEEVKSLFRQQLNIKASEMSDGEIGGLFRCLVIDSSGTIDSEGGRRDQRLLHTISFSSFSFSVCRLALLPPSIALTLSPLPPV